MPRLRVWLLMLLFPLVVEAQTVRISTGEYMPFCGKDAKHQGFASHVISEAFARQGYQVEFEFLPWKRAMQQAQLGKYHASSWWVYKQDRAEHFLYSDEVLRIDTHFFYLKYKHPYFDWNTLTDLKGKRVGITRGYHYSQALTDYRVQGGLFEEVNGDAQNIRLLIKGRIDLFPITREAGFELLRTQFSAEQVKNITFHPKPLISDKGFLIFPKSLPGSEQLRRVFNAGMQAIRADGSYQRMLENLRNGYYSGDEK